MSRPVRNRRRRRVPTDGPYQILVVDDEPDLERLVRIRLRREIRSGRFVLHFARDGVEALDKLADDTSFDIVLSDINMPRMDGLTLLEQIPKVDPDLRAVVVSAYGDMQNIRTAMNRGAFDFLTKPIDFKDLKVTIERSLRNLKIWRAALKDRDRLVSIRNELDLASQMQQSILPKQFPSNRHYDVHCTMNAAKEVGGDFYDLVVLPGGRLGVAIADVSGKGVPAALFMMSTRTLLKGAEIGWSDPGQVLGQVNDVLSQDNAAMMFVTLLYSILDPPSGRFSYACGGHDPPLLVHADGSCEFLQHSGGMALGVFRGADYQCRTVQLSPGDTLVLFTDGVTEAQNTKGEQFGMERLEAVFSSAPPASAERANAAVVSAVSEFVGGAAQFDDLTCAAVRYRGGQP